MKHVTILSAKLRLKLTRFRVKIAKNRMNREFRSARTEKAKMGNRYERFLACCKEQERAAVTLKRLVSRRSDTPILKTDLGVEHYIIQPDLADKITRLEAETALTRHRYGDWGYLSRRRWRENNEKVIRGDGILRSRYPLYGKGFFVVETDRSRKVAVMYAEGKSA